MKNYNYLMERPAVAEKFIDQTESADHKAKVVEECLENGTGAIYDCDGGAYGYFIPADDANVNLHIPAVRRLLLVGKPTEEITTVREAFDYLGWDYEAEKKEFSENGLDLDEIRVGFVEVD